MSELLEFYVSESEKLDQARLAARWVRVWDSWFLRSRSSIPVDTWGVFYLKALKKRRLAHERLMRILVD